MKIVNRNFLRAGTALQALALVGASLGGAMMMSAPVAAQDFTSVAATGRVLDASGKAIAGATVAATSRTQGFTRTATTDSSGSYRIPSLPQGNYSFAITAPGFTSFTDANVNLTAAGAGNEFQLVAEGTASSSDAGGMIVVTGRRTRIQDFDRTTTGTVIEIGELAQRVPVARDLTSVILLAPGTAAGDTAFGNLAAISGSSVSENVFFLNGLNITEFRQGLGSVAVPFEFYNTIEVKNGGIPAEYGRFTGGFVNATTKSGGNEIHGGALVSFEPDALRWNRPNTIGGTNLGTGFNKRDFNQQLQANFYASGPIIKDRLFVYGFYQANYNRTGDTLLTSNTGTFPGYSVGLRREERESSSPFWGAKVDAIITDGHRLEFTYFDSSQTTTINNFNVIDETGRSYDTRRSLDARPGSFQGTNVLSGGGKNYVARYTGQFAKWITVSAAYGKNQRRDIAGSSNDAYPFISDTSGAFPGSPLTGNSLNAINVSRDQRIFYRGDVDLYFQALGQHHVKFGYDREQLTTDSSTRYTGGVAWAYARAGGGDDYAPEGTVYVAGRTFVNGGVFKSLNEAFYVQDAWSLFENRLTLNLGVRNDRFSNKNVAGATYYSSGNNWAPRLSFSFDVFGDHKSKLYGSFGRYFLPIVANTNIRLAGAELDYTSYFRVNGINPDSTPILGAALLYATAAPCPNTGVRNCDITGDGVATPTDATVAKNLKAQSVDEYQIGFEQSLGNRIKVGIFGQYRKLNASLEDVAIDAAVNTYCAANNIAGCPAIFSGFHQYVLVNPGNAARITLSDAIGGETTPRTIDFTAAQLGYPKARRTYKAVTVTFDREFDGVWSLAGSYTLSESKGNIEGGIRSDNGQTDSGLTTAFDQPGLTDGTFGLLPGNATHRLKLYGAYQVTKWFTFGANLQVQSPRNFGCIGRVPSARDAFAGLYGAAGFYCNLDSSGNVIVNRNVATSQSTLKLTPRGSQFTSDWLYTTNISMNFRLPIDKLNAFFRVDIFNVFNTKSRLDFEERGTLTAGNPRADYGQPLIYQTPRYFRFQLGFDF
jgi:hypothetical protein